MNKFTFCDHGEEEPWLTQAGWHEKLRQYVTAQRLSDADENYKDVLWLYIPDWARNGNIASINEVPTRYSQDEVLWRQDPHCSGHRISHQPCRLRVEEMEMVSFRPEEC